MKLQPRRRHPVVTETRDQALRQWAVVLLAAVAIAVIVVGIILLLRG